MKPTPDAKKKRLVLTRETIVQLSTHREGRCTKHTGSRYTC